MGAKKKGGLTEGKPRKFGERKPPTVNVCDYAFFHRWWWLFYCFSLWHWFRFQLLNLHSKIRVSDNNWLSPSRWKNFLSPNLIVLLICQTLFALVLICLGMNLYSQMWGLLVMRFVKCLFLGRFFSQEPCFGSAVLLQVDCCRAAVLGCMGCAQPEVTCFVWWVGVEIHLCSTYQMSIL